MKKKTVLSILCAVMAVGILSSAAEAAGLKIEARNSPAYHAWRQAQVDKMDQVINPEAYYEDTMYEGKIVTPMSRFSRPAGDLTYQVPIYTTAYNEWVHKRNTDPLAVTDPTTYYEDTQWEGIYVTPISRFTANHKARKPINTNYDENVNIDSVEGDWHKLQYYTDINIEPVTAEEVRFDGYYADVHR